MLSWILRERSIWTSNEKEHCWQGKSLRPRRWQGMEARMTETQDGLLQRKRRVARPARVLRARLQKLAFCCGQGSPLHRAQEEEDGTPPKRQPVISLLGTELANSLSSLGPSSLWPYHPERLISSGSIKEQGSQSPFWGFH
jgi:hypothetical protein